MKIADKILESSYPKIVKDLFAKIRLASNKNELEKLGKEIDSLAKDKSIKFKHATDLMRGIDMKLDKMSESKQEPMKRLKHPFKSYTGVTWSKEQVDQYNQEVDKVNSYIESGKKVPENILNGMNNLFKAYSQKGN